MGRKLPVLNVCVWPTAGGSHQHGNQTCKCMNERFNQRHSEREAAVGSATAAPELNFDRWNQARVMQGHWRMCSHGRQDLNWYLTGSINFMGVCIKFPSSRKELRLKWNSYEYQKEGVPTSDKVWTPWEYFCYNSWEPIAMQKNKIKTIAQQPWLRKTGDKFLSTTAHQRNLNLKLYTIFLSMHSRLTYHTNNWQDKRKMG